MGRVASLSRGLKFNREAMAGLRWEASEMACTAQRVFADFGGLLPGRDLDTGGIDAFPGRVRLAWKAHARDADVVFQERKDGG
ncbi:hypothetical protein HNR46_000009 [Haloferula luteola]|uniref:Uncharacterized protein n=1 Tax=Haloferula luteola TaxID=595692 RepID=A0A840V4R9_9BACT|nr:hypothetical protein [Haloferula luteola]